MTEKESDELLKLLRKIDRDIMTIQIDIAIYKIISRLGNPPFNDILINLSVLILQVVIAAWGFQYISTTNTAVPPIAIIGVIGVLFTIINSLLKLMSNIYYIIMAIKNARTIGLSFFT